MKQGQRKRKKKPASPKPTQPVPGSISHALASVSLEEAGGCSENEGITGSELGTTTSSSDSASGWSQGLLGNPFRGSNKAKRLVAATGTVSTVLGKDYLKPSPKKEAFRPIGFPNRVLVGDSEEAEQFLTNMLGEDCELSLAVVRDVMCQCGYNVEKALDVLLDMSGSSDECSTSTKSLIDYASSREDARFVVSSDENFADRESESTSNSCESEFQDSIWFAGNSYKNYSEALVGSEIQSSTCSRTVGANVSQEVLDSFYKIYKSPQHEPRTMNWRDIAKKMSSFNNGIGVSHSIEEPPKGEEYVLCRKEARQHWDSMKSTYQKAATAYSKGEKSYAAYLSDQGKKYSRMGQEADERASHEIFRARNKSIENVITIDLHGQHVKQAMRLLKFHLLLPSIQKLRVITGCGSHGSGKSKLKQMVIKLAHKEGIVCVEENRGTVVLKLEGRRDFSFLDCESDSD